VESEKFPLLQVKGSGGFYYAQKEVREIIAYARIVARTRITGGSRTERLSGRALIGVPFRDRQIAACQLLYGSYPRLFVIDGAEKIRAQQLGEFPRIDAIAFVADFQQRIPARIAGQHSRDMRLEQVTCKLPRRPWINCRMVAAFVSRMDSITMS